ncbi:diguanylate cyclase [Geopsychrobacter electrodiphilus]|uniref:diguanylate cyclase n=1 Tax=Geopsychrobacter electrodiphilus TaxID=225196 RepID=UPI00037E5FA8|nr:diguanylate cyclase [Geopsychrobacter electrodiphilus]
MRLKKILVVDDEVFFRDILKEALHERYQIIEGENGEQAVALAEEHQPNLIILDVMMPDGNGIDVCRILKANAATHKIPVILFTALSKKEDIVLGLKAGADDYITKPICLSEIVARVDAHLRTKDYYSDLLHKDLLLLLELAENISAIRNPMTILRIIVEKMSAIIDVARCSIVSINGNGDLYVKASNDLDENMEIRLDLAKYPEIRKSLETKRAVIVNNIQQDPLMDSVRPLIKDLRYNSIIVIPVLKKENIIGTFFLRTASPFKGGITDRIYKVCQLVANISANALENAMLFDTMKTAQEYFEEMSIRDGLTKLYNHRHFYNRLEEEFSRADRYNSSLSLLFFDIDDFKRINDVYGHACGDEVLRQIGLLIKMVARDIDIPARYGGEEFAIILPNTSAEGAFDLATRLRATVKAHLFSCLKNDHVTISIGVSTFAHKNIPAFDSLVHMADAAMYKAKAQGKDCVFQI